MADQDLALEFVAQRRLGDLLQRDRRDVVGLVGMEIEVEPELDRMREHAVEQFLEVRHHVGDGAEHAFRRGDPLRQRLQPGEIARAVDAEQARRLQLDAALPALPHLLEHRPRDLLLRRHRIEMRADRLGAVRVGAAQRELHALRDVGCVPARGAVLAGRIERAHEGAVGIALARPDMALVDMRVAVDEGRQHDAAGEVDRRRLAAPSVRAAMLLILPSATAMSASAKPSASKAASKPGVSERCTRALASRYGRWRDRMTYGAPHRRDSPGEKCCTPASEAMAISDQRQSSPAAGDAGRRMSAHTCSALTAPASARSHASASG